MRGDRPSTTDGSSSKRAAGRYVLGDLLGRGGMAEVFAGHSMGDHGFQKPVAIKRLLPELASDHVFVERLIEEAKLLVGMQHGNIVSVIDLARDGDDVFLVMEFVDGPSLRQLLKARGSRGLSLGVATYIVQAAAAGLEFAHNRPGGAIIHADISPSNLLLTTSGEVRVADFGIARREGGGHGVVEGKWAYMAPEQARGEPLTPRSDVFALGVVLYELLCGQHPLGRQVTHEERDSEPMRVLPPRVVKPSIPTGLDAICMRALAHDPRDRYRSMQQLIDAIVEERFGNHLREAASDLASVIREGSAEANPFASGPRTMVTDRPVTIMTSSLLPEVTPARRSEPRRRDSEPRRQSDREPRRQSDREPRRRSDSGRERVIDRDRERERAIDRAIDRESEPRRRSDSGRERIIERDSRERDSRERDSRDRDNRGRFEPEPSQSQSQYEAQSQFEDRSHFEGRSQYASRSHFEGQSQFEGRSHFEGQSRSHFEGQSRSGFEPEPSRATSMYERSSSVPAIPESGARTNILIVDQIAQAMLDVPPIFRADGTPLPAFSMPAAAPALAPAGQDLSSVFGGNTMSGHPIAVEPVRGGRWTIGILAVAALLGIGMAVAFHLKPSESEPAPLAATQPDERDPAAQAAQIVAQADPATKPQPPVATGAGSDVKPTFPDEPQPTPQTKDEPQPRQEPTPATGSDAKDAKDPQDAKANPDGKDAAGAKDAPKPVDPPTPPPVDTRRPVEPAGNTSVRTSSQAAVRSSAPRKEPGFLRVRTTPWAWAIVGNDKQETPGAKFKLAPGHYTVRLNFPSLGVTETHHVTIESTRTFTLNINKEDE